MDGNRAHTRLPNISKNTPHDELERHLESLIVLDTEGAKEAWSKIAGREPPPGANRDLLIRDLAYRLQARVYGDLDRRHKQLLDKIAGGDVSGIGAEQAVGANLKPGTVLVREYKDEIHRVTVVAGGYSWNGQTLATLSAAAKAITGSNWNGYVFFGLKTKSSKSVRADG
jgi:hypothetical protein